MSNTDMTQEQFFDELDKLFGTDDGYINHLERIKEAVSGDTMIRNHPYPTKLRNENEKLKAEACDYESMRKHRDTLLEESEERFMKIRNLEEEITRLKEESDHIQSDLEDEQEEHHWTQNDLEQLKEDLEPLQAMMDMIKDVNEYKDVVDYVYGLHGKNLELQEKLEESDVDWKSKYENEQSTNKMLNEAIINHSEVLDEIRQYLSNFDGDEVEVFDKIVKSTD